MEPAALVRVGIVEDEAMMRSMLEQSLSNAHGIEVALSVATVAEARKALAPGQVDVAVIDVNLADGNGVSLGLQLQRADQHLAVLLLSAEDVMGLFQTAQPEASRPWSYLSKRTSYSSEALAGAVLAAARGDVVIDPYLVDRSQPRAGTTVAELTPSQFNVLRLVAEGLSNQAAAERLGINTRGVESHLKSIYQRLGIDGDGSNRRVAAVLAFLEQTGRVWRG